MKMKRAKRALPLIQEHDYPGEFHTSMPFRKVIKFSTQIIHSYFETINI